MARRDALLPVSHAAGWRWALLGGLLGVLAALAVWAPARWLAGALEGWSGGHLRLVQARGTVWNGSAGVVLASGAGGADPVSLPGRLAWRLRPALDGVRGRLDLPCCTPQGLGFRAQVAGAAGAGWRLAWQDAPSRWPAAMLSGLGAPWNTLRPEGTLDLRTRGFSLRWRDGRLDFDGAATVDAVDISSSLSTLRPMGSYRVALEGGPAASLLLTTTEGSLQLAGSGRWTGRAMRFSGEAAAAPGSEDALSNLLNIIGRREGARSIISLG
ncbi:MULTISPECIES: type II secretion system protein N [Xenophilus]|uniref:type II secretion system protein N n=1 Tax=Xenophilus TaxID=151754 RepID=UPI000571C0A1|nr:type II secretion system protein N [Xenophilus azovorans]